MVAIRPPTHPLTDRTISVRLPAADDADALVRYGDDPDVKETIWIPIPTPCDRAQAVERLSEFERSWQDDGRFGPTLMIAEQEGDRMIGVVFLRAREHDSIELSYGVAAEHRNRGIATAALLLVSRWCLAELSASRVELRIGQDNLASQRVAAKAGFAREGIVRSHVAGTGRDYDDLLYTRA
jgi:RimJ/RimL family protein N-acetyltransferase